MSSSRSLLESPHLVRVGERQVVLRRPPCGAQAKGGHDMALKFNLLSALQGPYGKLPRPLVHGDEESVLGAPFYLIGRVRGVEQVARQGDQSVS